MRNALARQIHELSAYCSLVILTAHVRQVYEDGEPGPQVKEAKFYDRVWQALDLVGYLVRDDRQGAPRALFAPPYGKTRVPAMASSLAPFSWQQVFGYAVGEFDVPTSEQRQQHIQDALSQFRRMVGESA